MNKLILVMSIFCSSILGKIIEVNTIFEMNKYEGKNVLFLYDIDNTLVRPAQDFGSDQWFFARYKSLAEELKSKERALDQALSEWTAIQYLTKVKEVEPKSAEQIALQQKKGLKIIGFTTRDLCLSRCTKKQLNSLNIDFSKSRPCDEDIYFKNKNGVLYSDGILYTCGTDKGDALFIFLNKIHYYPTKIVFINDKKSHLDEVERACRKHGIEFIGLRYNYMDEDVNSFSLSQFGNNLKRLHNIF